MRVRFVISTLSLGLLIVAGCKSNDVAEPQTGMDEGGMQTSMGEASTPPEPVAETSPVPPSTPEGTETTPQAPAAVPLSDAQIAAILGAADQKEIEVSKLAQKQAKSADVKAFATMMVKHHGESSTKAQKILTASSITPQPSEKSDELTKSKDADIEELKGKKGDEFDRAYMAKMLDDHQKVLGFIDDKAIPGVKDAALKAHVQEVRGVVDGHLTKAKEIHAKLEQAEQKKQTPAAGKPQPGASNPKSGPPASASGPASSGPTAANKQ